MVDSSGCSFKVAKVVKLHVGSTSTRQTIGSLRKIFFRFGILQQIITDNRSQFTTDEFKTFCDQQGILHSQTPAYHPRSNGQAERFVHSFKRGFKKGMEEPGAQLDVVVDAFLATYRNTSHHTTGEYKKTTIEKPHKPLMVGDAVLVRQLNSRGKEIWRPAAIISVWECDIMKFHLLTVECERRYT